MLSDRGIIMNAKPKIAIGVLAVLLVAAIIFGCVFYTREGESANQNQALNEQVASLTAQVEELTAQVDALTAELAAAQADADLTGGAEAVHLLELLMGTAGL